MIDIKEDRVIFMGSFDPKNILEFKTIRAYKCPSCLNPILVEFLTTKEVKLSEFEQTRLLYTQGSEVGNLREIVPNHSSHNSAYESSFNKALNLQTIRLKNHMVEPGTVDKRVDGSKGEKGYTPCGFTAIVSCNERLVVRDLILLSIPAEKKVPGIPPYEILDAANQGSSKPYFLRVEEIQKRFPAAILITISAYNLGFNFHIKKNIEEWLKETA